MISSSPPGLPALSPVHKETDSRARLFFRCAFVKSYNRNQLLGAFVRCIDGTGGDGVDDALVRAACSGDRDSLSALCESLYPPLRRFFIGLAGPGGADDLTQEALMRVLDRLPGFTLLPGARFEGWVFRIAYRLFLDAKRRRAELPLPDWECADLSEGPEETAVAREREAAVRGAVGRLPDELRAMVTMRYALDMCYRDIARALGVAEYRVKWRLHDALKRLRAELKEVQTEWTNG